MGGKTNTEYTGSLGYNSVFRVCYITSIDVDVILDTCSTIEIIIIHLPSAVCALTFLARRIQPFLSLVDREVEFCVLAI